MYSPSGYNNNALALRAIAVSFIYILIYGRMRDEMELLGEGDANIMLIIA